MTLTRSQRGITPRKTEYYGMEETPATTRKRSTRQPATISETPSQKGKSSRARKSVPSSSDESQDESAEHANGTVKVETPEPAQKRSPQSKRTSKETNGHAVSPAKTKKAAAEEDYTVDNSGHFEFGGTPGVTAVMIGFPLLMYYMWVGATYYDGKPPMPAKDQSLAEFFQHLGALIYEGAFPNVRAWAIYWTFFAFECACYVLLPGVTAYGKPLPHLNGKQLPYYCSGNWALYTSLAVGGVLHFTGLFPLYILLDEFGPILSVAIISGVLVSIVAYVSAVWRGATHRMTGHLIYDFFMGAELNPRMFTVLDFKMFFEVRIPWYMLLFLSLGTAARQMERYGYVSPEVVFLVMAHYLYANACSKAEDLIVTTWDMYYEKWGFMLIFWNLAGVPLSYCHCTIYMANHHPSEYAHSTPVVVLLFASYLFVYWVWDSANSQKNRFRQAQHGGFVTRRTFPQVPWQVVKNPRTIPVPGGDPLLADGWYGYARKIHYTCDLFFAVSWAAVCGFSSPFPWFYPIFFAAMIQHRARRDIERCRERYGDAWREYERQVPYLFIPYVF